jgi:hypothetical protein
VSALALHAPDSLGLDQAAAWWGFHYGINGGMKGKEDLLGTLHMPII